MNAFSNLPSQFDPQTNQSESLNNQNTFSYERYRKFQERLYNPSINTLGSFLFCEKKFNVNGPLMVTLHILNGMLAEAMGKMIAAKKANNPMAIEYFKYGEHYSHQLDTRGTAEYLAKDDMKHLIFCDSRLILEMWRPHGIQTSGHSTSLDAPEGGATVAFSGSNFMCVNYWGVVPMGDIVGFILTKAENGPYMFKPYCGQQVPTPSELLFRDAAGYLQRGAFIRVGQGQFAPKSSYYTGPRTVKQNILCGLEKTSPERIEELMPKTPQISLILDVGETEYA
jgi:hypothetical protein